MAASVIPVSSHCEEETGTRQVSDRWTLFPTLSASILLTVWWEGLLGTCSSRQVFLLFHLPAKELFQRPSEEIINWRQRRASNDLFPLPFHLRKEKEEEEVVLWIRLNVFSFLVSLIWAPLPGRTYSGRIEKETNSARKVFFHLLDSIFI